MIENFIIQFLTPIFILGVLSSCVYLLIPDQFVKLKIAVIILGCFLIGSSLYYAGKKNEREDNEAIKANMEKELADAKAKSTEKTIEIVTKYVDKIKVIEKEKIVYATKTNEVLNDKIVNNYPVPNGFIRLHNSAAEGTIPEGPRNSDEEPSTFKINQVAETVIDNYIVCRENTEQLQALQSWVKEQELLFNGK